ncbi:hypothetical protein EDF57_10680 [Novosphingobium sp. PhB55]|uniref:hypothetical protein n=1 Tax=Novosphingobium sp. PhB55 TaxID=2485106 RepID=UPI001065226B|nr:hypothetical protein [Novosphingobium sp. PhB55]TDW63125.1 hypothetical protein EDF57_10680 [Novosphingobium sp. PhB55]
MTAPTILVTGLGRCGTSLVMQMLDAAGGPTIGAFPAFEEPAEVALRAYPERWSKLAAGKAVKILNPHLNPPPAQGSYRTIYLSRDFAEQAKSTLKFAGAAASRADRRTMEVQLQTEHRQAHKALIQLGTGMYFNLPFEDLITRPLECARDIASFVSARREVPLDPHVMAACVKPRDPACLPYLLELDLIA